MIQDKQLEFSNAQAITATASSTNVIDLGPKNGRGTTGPGTPIEFTVGQTFVGAGTLTIQIRTSDSADMSGATVVAASPAFTAADLVAGKDLPYYPHIPVNTKRYVDLNYVASSAFTAGTLTARGTAAAQIGG
ncbi:Bbp16 family capsid cement protein [Microvirga mediterraneensis]|uniref:Uncharacterized protein n=1 Tax=Microvirga mediterraneensis TaxID=2754695 RepID=A0A838BWU5_9HYPH|nr:hypothetical protein [Microvirga mediterraneensis]MBA1159383.1 hypothetical protein [Microvirga mediterraneensis]